MTDHLVDAVFIAWPAKTWNRLAAQKQKRNPAAQAAVEYNNENRIKEEGELQAFFKAQGLKVYKPDLEAFPLPRAEGLSQFRVVQDLAEGNGRAYQRRQVSVASIARRSGMAQLKAIPEF